MKLKLYYFALMMTPLPLLAADPSTSTACTGARAVGATCTKAGFTTATTSIFSALFFLIGTLSVGVLIYGGIRYITSTGDASQIKAAKETVIYAIVGLVVAILAQAIVSFVIGRVHT